MAAKSPNESPAVELSPERQREVDAAKYAGLISDSLGPREICRLPRSVAEDAKTYKKIRNAILIMWKENSTQYLAFEDVIKNSEDKQKDLVREIYNFLNHYGYINAGILTNHPAFSSAGLENRNRKRIVVIGAGMSGITAARQLKGFGHDVVVIEGRNRIGGRVNTDNKTFGSPVDLGASIITGLVGNPLRIVTDQLGTKMHNINVKCPLFLPDGTELPEDEDDKIWNLYNSILDGTDQLRKILKERKDVETLAKMDLLSAMNEVKAEKIAFEDKHQENIINWHITNLEYGCATSLNELSLEHWDQDDSFGFSGDHLFLREGYSTVIQALAGGLDIKLNCTVKSINYDDKIVKISYLENGTEKTEEADMVLVTVSLGVLKSQMVKFTPRLPIWKQGAINRLGFGLINKLVLEFKEEDVFWRDNDMFGHVNDSVQNRGSNYMIWNLKNVTGKPILVSIISGTAAHDFELIPEEKLVSEVMAQLRKIYGQDIPNPKKTLKTSWKSDPFARGTYSFVKVGSSGDDYDALARPVDKKVFFAGEATCRLYPATVPGAHASGLFAAGQIADTCNNVTHRSLTVDFGMYKSQGGNRLKRGFRQLREKQLNRDKIQKDRHWESAISDLMEGKIDLDEAHTKRPRLPAKRSSPSLFEDIVSLEDGFGASGAGEETGQETGLPVIGACVDDNGFENVDNDNLDLADTLMTKKHRKRQHEIKSRQRLKKKLKTELKRIERKKKGNESGSSGQPDKNPENYITGSIKRLLAKYVKSYNLQPDQQDTILQKSSAKVINDWNSKERSVSIKKWMGGEKRRNSIKSLVSKYSKSCAKKNKKLA